LSAQELTLPKGGVSNTTAIDSGDFQISELPKKFGDEVVLVEIFSAMVPLRISLQIEELPILLVPY
jgi:hypothetical protein